jgi:site-specific recombinase XerD
LEAPAPALVPERRTAIQAAIDHFVKLKESKSPDTRRKNRRVLMDFKSFMEASPRNYQFITDVRFSDLTDVASAWQGSNRSKVRDLGILTSFLKYCHRAEFTSKKHWRRIVQDLELAR